MTTRHNGYQFAIGLYSQGEFALRIRLQLVALLTLIVVYLVDDANGQEVDFAHEVLPILRQHCVKCHSNGTYRSGFSIDTRSSILNSGQVDSDSPDESELIQRLISPDPDYRMPPESDPLPAEQVATLRRWIGQGLPWETGFTFTDRTWVAPLAPRNVTLPPGDGHPIDRLIDAYFARKKVTWPAPISDEQFLRRVYLDLIGLLPTPSERQRFLSSSEGMSRDQLVDQLLARNRDYADHWMSFWNDLLRNDYAGTGYIDGGRKQITSWLYRALYENKPYDQFVRELINPGEESAGFINGIKWRGDVNASQVQELQFAQNTSQVFLGENMKCASCHDSFINERKLSEAYGLAAIIADRPLEIYRCDKPTGEFAEARFLWPELGSIEKSASKRQRLAKAAELFTHPQNGRFARTIVNRIWQRLMGQGIVEPVDIMANRPWDEDVLDHLANQLVENNYDLRAIMRLIVTSRVYQVQCTPTEENPSSESVFRGPIAKRMTAEQFMDAVWTLTSTHPKAPHAVIEGHAMSNTKGQPTAIRASLVNADLLMRSLGRPNREQVVTTRDNRLSTLQALDLSNGPILYGLLQTGSEKMHQRYSDRDELVATVFLQTLCRLPTTQEKQIARDMLGSTMQPSSIADFVWAVIMLPEFQYVR